MRNSIRAKRLRLGLMVLCAAFLVIGPTLSGTDTAWAQGSMLTISQEQQSQFERRLNLSESQKPAVVAIIERTIRDGDAIFRKHGVTGRPGDKPGLFQLIALNSDMDGVNQWARVELSKVLSPAQMHEYDKIYAERREVIKNKLLR